MRSLESRANPQLGLPDLTHGAARECTRASNRSRRRSNGGATRSACSISARCRRGCGSSSAPMSTRSIDGDRDARGARCARARCGGRVRRRARGAHAADEAAGARGRGARRPGASDRGQPRVGCRAWARRVRARRRATPRSTRAEAIAADDVRRNRLIGAHGAALVPVGGAVLTHCNTGALACVGYGTALGVVRAAFEAGRRPRAVGRRDAAAAAGRAAHDVGVRPARHRRDAHRRRRGRGVDGAGDGRPRDRRRRPHRRERRRREQDRHLRARGRGASSSDPVLRRRARVDDRSRDRDRRRRSRSRSAIPTRSRTSGRTPIAPPGVGAFNPAFDVTPGAPRDRDRDRVRRRPARRTGVRCRRTSAAPPTRGLSHRAP